MSDRLSATNVGRKSGGTRLPSPAAGAYVIIPITIGDGTTVTQTDVYNLDDLFPAGMKFRILGLAVLNADLSAGSASVELGTSGDADGIVTATAAADGVAVYNACDGALANDIDGSGNGDYLFNPADSSLDELRLTVTRTGATTVGLQVHILAIPLYHPDLIVERSQPTVLN